MNKQDAHQKGFTLIEVMIAIAVAAIGIMAVGVMQTSSVKKNDSAQILTAASTLGAALIEKLMALPYDHPLLVDTDGDGTGRDPDGDGIDNNDNGDFVLDQNENFGLHHATAADADHYSGILPQGPNSRDNLFPVEIRFNVFWNIAVDVPLPDCKLIRVIIEWNDHGFPRTLCFDSAKRRW